MNIGGIGNAASLISGGAPSVGPSTQGAEGGGNAFGQLLADLQGSSQQADGAMNGLALGGPGDLHDVVLATQYESLSFELAVQIRNRLVDAYSEIFRMQV